MTDARLESEGMKYLHFKVASKSHKGKLHDVSIKKENLAGWCTCDHVPFRERKAGKRELKDVLGRPTRSYMVGPAGTCRHVKIAKTQAEYLLQRGSV